MTAAVELFLGLPLTRALEEALAEANPALLELFLHGGDAYLQERRINSIQYLGKPVGAMTDLAALEEMERHIQSLVARLVPSAGACDCQLMIRDKGT